VNVVTSIREVGPVASAHSEDTLVRTLVSPGRQTELIGLDIAEIPAGGSLDVQRDGELVAVVFSGVVEVAVNGEHLGRAGGRQSVFDGPGYAAYAPPSATVSFTAAEGPVELALATAPLGRAGIGRPRLVGPREQQVADRGKGNFARRVRTIFGPDEPGGRLLVGETINPPGNWSSYPPHKHDEQRPPAEARFEEVYLFKVQPPGGFGVQIRYTAAGEEAFLVRDGDAAVIRSGYHPVVAAPGYALYYLWALAGEGRQPIMYFDPAHRWVEDGRTS
jgi:5-deoxy-glucuronate isomerase